MLWVSLELTDALRWLKVTGCSGVVGSWRVSKDAIARKVYHLSSLIYHLASVSLQ